MEWNQLSVRDRAKFIKQMVSLGITTSKAQEEFFNNSIANPPITNKTLVNIKAEGGHLFDGDPAAQVTLPTVVKQGKSRMFTPGWWNKQADKLDKVAFGAGFIPVVGDAVSFLADVGANFARYQYDKNDPYLPEWQRKEIAKSNLKTGLGLAGAGALMGLAGVSMPSSKIKQAAKLNFRSMPESLTPKPELYSQFDDMNVQIADLPDYAQNPSATNIRLSTNWLDKRFNYKDWIERMENKPLNDEEFNALRKAYPKEKPEIIRDVEWKRSHFNTKDNKIHVGEEGEYSPEIERLITAHETDHALGIPTISETEIEKLYGPIKSQYFKDNNSTEMLARLGQIANWYGITNIRQQPLTGNMLKYAAQQGNYVKKAKIDNDMLDFFTILKNNNSWETAAKAYNQYGKSIVPPALLIGTGAGAYNRFNKDKKEYANGGHLFGGNPSFRERYANRRESTNVVDLRDLPPVTYSPATEALLSLPALWVGTMFGEENIPGFLKTQRMENIDEAHRRAQKINPNTVFPGYFPGEMRGSFNFANEK